MAIEKSDLIPQFCESGSPGPFVEEGSRGDLMDLIAEDLSKRHPIHLKLLLDAIEKGLILKVLDKTAGNQKKAARILGIKYTTLNQKIKRYRLKFRRSIEMIDS